MTMTGWCREWFIDVQITLSCCCVQLLVTMHCHASANHAGLTCQLPGHAQPRYIHMLVHAKTMPRNAAHCQDICILHWHGVGGWDAVGCLLGSSQQASQPAHKGIPVHRKIVMWLCATLVNGVTLVPGQRQGRLLLASWELVSVTGLTITA
jgi:hypothetical protein